MCYIRLSDVDTGSEEILPCSFKTHYLGPGWLPASRGGGNSSKKMRPSKTYNPCKQLEIFL